MARQKENTNRINVFLSDADYAALKDKADRQGSNVSLLVRGLIKKDLESYTVRGAEPAKRFSIDEIFAALPGVAKRENK